MTGHRGSGVRCATGVTLTVVRFATVADGDDEHEQHVVLDLVDDAVVTGAYPPQPWRNSTRWLTSSQARP